MSDPDTQLHIDALKARIREAMMNSDALWATDVDGLAEVAVQAIGTWMEEPSGLSGLFAGPFTSREKWLRFHFRPAVSDPDGATDD